MNCEELRKRILDSQQLPLTHQILNVKKFLQENEQFFDKLNRLIHTPSTPELSSKPPQKSKSVSKFTLPRPTPPTPSLSSLPTLQKRNIYLQSQLSRLHTQQYQKQLKQNPYLQNIQQQIKHVEQQINIKNQINKQFNDINNNKIDLFQMYQKMCRRCQVIRKENDQISQNIKECIKKINQISGKDQNPNLFIMNFK